MKPGSVTATFAGGTDRTGYQDLDPFNTTERRRVAQLGQPGRRRRPLRQRRHPRHPHPGDGADDRPPRRAEVGPHVPQPRQRAAAHPRRDPGAQVRRTASNRLDPDGNPDTSFLAKIPADVAFTFQTLDKHGMVLNMAQTWHQVRPGEVRNDCGGCHAHSQKPTVFEQTAAAKPDYDVFDLTAADAAADRRRRSDESRQEVGREGRDRPALREAASRTSSTSATSSRSSTAAASPATPQKDGNAGRQPRARRRQDREPARRRRRARHLLPPGDGLRRPLRPQAGHRLVAAARTPRATSACSSRAAACWSGRSSASGSTAGPTTTSRPRRRRATPQTLQLKGEPVAEHAGQPQPRRPRLHRQRHAAAGRGEGGQGRSR